MSAGQPAAPVCCYTLRRPKFAAKVPPWLVQRCQRVLGQAHARSLGNVLSVVQDLWSVYAGQARTQGWTHHQFTVWLADSLRGRVNSLRSLQRYTCWLERCGVIQLERFHGWRRGTILRVHLPHVLEVNGTPEHWSQQADQRRQQDRARQARCRAKKRGRAADGRPLLGGVPILDGTELAKEVDQIELEWANTPAKSVPASVSRLHTTRSVPAGGQPLPTALPAVQKEKQIPQTPSCAGGRKSLAAPDVSNGATTVAELQQRLCQVVAGGPMARDKLKAEWLEVYDDLRRAHPGGLGPYGLGGQPSEEVSRVCLQVARRHAKPATAPPQPLKQRCARLRSRVDSRAAAATAGQLSEAMADALGPEAAATIRAHSLAQVGLPLAVAELVLERVCRQLKVGSSGPTALRASAAMPAYVFKSFRKEAAR